MSGASALASARRRRAETTPQIITPNTSNTTPAPRNNNVDDSQKQQVTPLQILQTHDLKLKELESTLESKVVEIAKAVLEENLKHLNLDKGSSVSSDDGYLVKRIDKLTESLEELKMLVIKNQTLGLETNGEMLKLQNDSVELKTKITLLENDNNGNDKVIERLKVMEENNNNVNEKLLERLKVIEENVSELENIIKEDENDQDNLFNLEEGSPAEMLLRSMMQGSYNIPTNTDNEEQEIHKLNIHDNESESSNDIGDVSELTLTESDLNLIKNEVKNELKEELVNLENLTEETDEKEKKQKEDLIEVSDNEVNE